MKDPRDDSLITKIAEACLFLKCCRALSARACVLMLAFFHADVYYYIFSFSHQKQKKKGVASSKRKKQAKLKRMIASVRKQQIKAEGNEGEARFAAMQLIDDPQGFAEMLFKKLKEGAQAFETKMLLLQVVSRVVGLHQLILLNFYPFLQRYIQPNQRDVRLYFLLVFKTFFFPCILCLVRVLEPS